MLYKLYVLLLQIRNADRIPKIPRMWRSEYARDGVSQKEWDILVKMGARDPNGIRIAMKRYGASSEKELYEMIEFYKPQLRPYARLIGALKRFVGGYGSDPNAPLIRQLVTPDRQNKAQLEIKNRIKHYKETK